ncbi:nucleotidyltransferase family protein [Saccharospirillum salsuginis]|uniref:Nitrate reductase n=1 Tax=Saccharospirillum salsuginis TaxID=418750 RepID=A0A918KIE9_9GAMM|nr:nucleotidyltransferase family protein [Saccharospirillum salsuginis]GGX62866.1 nitrate reductase [Saccharospirillum salsuginis]
MTLEQHYETISTWLREDDQRMACLRAVADLNLPDWCIAAGFVRNLVWDRLHDCETTSPLNDVDVVYFDPNDVSEDRDRALETRLLEQLDRPWSVKNQARMHRRNGDEAYRDTKDAMSYWPEIETAVGARLNREGYVELVSPFGLAPLMAGTVTMNTQRPKPEAFWERVEGKGWLERWPKLRVVD